MTNTIFNSGIGIRVLNNMGEKLKIVFAIAFLVVLVLFILYQVEQRVGLKGGYQLIDNRLDDVHIIKDGEIVIGSTVVDVDVLSNYLVGLRMPIRYLACNDMTSSKIKIVNSREYFVVDTDKAEVQHFTSSDAFEKSLASLGLIGEYSLNYSNFDRIWSKYSKRYSKDVEGDVGCVDFPVGSIEHEKTL